MENDSHTIGRFEPGAQPGPVTEPSRPAVAAHNAYGGASANARAHLNRPRRSELIEQPPGLSCVVTMPRLVMPFALSLI